MKSQTLTITGTNLETNQIEDAIIVASNPFMLAQKYIKATQTIYVQSWTLTNAKWNAGNSGLNAGAFLCETLEELTGLDLA
jgi:hypothetical protein